MNGRHPLGEVSNLWRYPVKSLAPEALRDVRVGTEGFEGDRQAALFVTTPGHARDGHTYRGKENNLLHTVGSSAQAVDLAAERAVEIEPREGGPHFDAGAISILIDTWLAELEVLVAMRLDPLRFRPNIFVHAAPGFATSEEALVGAMLTVGGVQFEVTAPIHRCVTTTYDIATGESEPRVLRACAQQRGNIMGVYCRVRERGTVSIGETVWVSR
jgi:uncharacterized protein YcbX